MQDTLSAVWGQVEAMLAAGVSLIPVRDKEEEGKPPKTPYARWKDYQSRIITAEELWHEMEHHNTTAVAMICGKVSGNLEAIDIDVKNWAGIDGLLFSAIRDLYPELFAALRIHSTPSGGYHVLYRTEGIVPGNQKLATSMVSVQAGIETRGEGGYIVAPPSLGYKIYQEQPIPLITAAQRESLINLAKSLNERVKVVACPVVTKQQHEYYDENPFEHFNASPEAERILCNHGWTEAGSNNAHLYFTRPGKVSGISASFTRTTRIYYVFSSSTGLEPNRGYHPATILSLLQFGGDKRLTYQHLVDQGYGRINPKKEIRMVRARAQAGEALPANASEQAKIIYLQTGDYLARTYPHGIYWVQEEEGEVKINRERLYTVAAGLGFRYHNGTVICIQGHVLHKVTLRTFFDVLKSYNVEAEPDFAEAIRNAWEAFIQRAGEFSAGRIELLDEGKILSSTKTVGYKCYSNGFVVITGESIELKPYDQLHGKLVWAHHIQPREFCLTRPEPTILPLYHSYLDLAIGISTYLWQIVGYLAHDFKDTTTGYIIILVESCEDPKQGGGSGKNVFCSLMSGTTTVRNIPGSQMQSNEKFLQTWQFERLVVISDVPKRFDYLFLKEPSTGSGILKKLYEDEVTIPVEQMPKFIISTQHSFEVSDGGLKRRLRPLEFTEFFTKAGGLHKYFGKMFPSDWTSDDWADYDHLILEAIQLYLRNPVIDEPELSASGWLKQFDQAHMQLTRQFIEQHWTPWMRYGFVSNELFREQYERFCIENNVALRYRLSSFGMNNALGDWCRHNNVTFQRDVTQRENTITTRGKWFGEQAPF